MTGRVPGLDAARPILDGLAHPVVVTDLETTVLYCNEAAAALYGVSPDVAVGVNAVAFLRAESGGVDVVDAVGAVREGRPWTGQFETLADEPRSVAVTLTPLRDAGGKPVALIGTAVDVTEAAADRQRLASALELVEQASEQLAHQALHDPLTGLPNRALILDRAEQMLTRSRRDRSPVAVLFVDLDNFKDVNDGLGHAAGDQLMRAVASRLTAAVREADTVGRLGGDEFVVLAEGSSLDAGASVVAERLLDVLREPFQLATDSSSLVVTASIGIAEGDRDNAEDLLRDADVALYRAKAAGRNRYLSFAPEMQTALADRISIDADLREALGRGELSLDYQPTFGLDGLDTVGAEALLRWKHPTRGVVAPLDFVPRLEATGLIVPVGRWVLAEACRQGAAWHREGLLLTVSVNVSGRQLEAESFEQDVIGALNASGLPPNALVIEITETTLMRDTDATLTRLNALKQVGVRVAIDDFGTGYSSLAYLRQFPVDILKIDRSFITGMTDSQEGEALLHTLVQLGKRLGLQTVAEGIETVAQLHGLQQEQCDTGQGFLVARPMSASDIEEFVRVSTGAARSA